LITRTLTLVQVDRARTGEEVALGGGLVDGAEEAELVDVAADVDGAGELDAGADVVRAGVDAGLITGSSVPDPLVDDEQPASATARPVRSAPS
jgi:hypothetical protein